MFINCYFFCIMHPFFTQHKTFWKKNRIKFDKDPLVVDKKSMLKTKILNAYFAYELDA